MPSSMCWPFRLSDHFCIETTFSERKTSSRSARSKMPRWFTQPPRLVETVTSGEVVTMRSASGAVALAQLVQDAAEGLLRRHAGAGAERQRVRQRHGRRGMPARLAVEGGGGDERLQRLLVEAEAGEARPLGAFVHVHRGAEVGHLLFGHDAGVVVLVAGEGQAKALDGVGDEAMGHVGVDLAQRLQHRLHVVAREVGHQVLQAVVVVAGEQRLDARRRGRCPGSAARARRRHP